MTKLNTLQTSALERLQRRWDYVGNPVSFLGGDDTVLVPVGTAEDCICMHIGIATDGSPHS